MAEFGAMVAALHGAGIEVILDVVLNHTAETDILGPTLSFRGLDNASYYRLDPADPRRYLDWSGCGNTLDLAHPRVLQLAMDSLRHWASLGVDGFRFDLATTLGRTREGGFAADAPLLQAIAQDPVLGKLKQIAEPWDLGPYGYRQGEYPAPFAMWNDRFRDSVRRFWRGDEAILPDLAGRLLGSADLYEHSGRRPQASLNLVTSHDGFTLDDLVTYAERHNEANGEGNRDGHHDNLSANHGVEGPTDDASIRALRQRQRRNLLATLLLAQGTPMLLMGDEFGRSQSGNNNAYCQDNELSWCAWDLDEDDLELQAFVARLVALRQAHPMLRQTRFLHGRQRSSLGRARRHLVGAHRSGDGRRRLARQRQSQLRPAADGRRGVVAAAGQRGATAATVCPARRRCRLARAARHGGAGRRLSTPQDEYQSRRPQPGGARNDLDVCETGCLAGKHSLGHQGERAPEVDLRGGQMG